MLTPLVPLLALSLGASVATVGFLVALTYLLPLFLAMPVGTLVDRRGPRDLITIGAVVMGIGPLAVAAFPGIVALAIAQVVVGLAHLLVGLATQSFVAGLGSGHRRERNFGWYTTSASGGQVLGPLIAGLLADQLGFQQAFLVAGSLSFVGVALSRWLPRGRRDMLSGSSFGGDLLKVGGFMRNHGIRLGIMASASGMFAMTAFQAFLPAYLEGLAFSATAIGMLISLKSLASMVIRPFMPLVIRLFHGRANTLSAMMLLIATSIGLTGFVSSQPLLVVLAIVFGFGFGISQPVSMVAVIEDVRAGNRGFVLGLRLTGNRVAQLIGPLLLGIVAEPLGFGPAFLVGAVVVVAASAVIFSWRAHGPKADQA